MAKTVVVVGAGAAGLQCAQLLRQEGDINVVVVEAADYVGGRIRQDWDFLDGKPMEMGAEYIHGCTTLLADAAERGAWRLRHVFTWAQGDGGPSDPAPDGGIGMYYLGKEGRWLEHDADDADMTKLHETCWALGSMDPAAVPSMSVSLAEHLAKEGVAERMMSLAEAGYANTAGGPMREQSLLFNIRLERHWEKADCEGDLRVEGTFARLIADLSRGVDVRTGWRVESVRHGPAGCTVTSVAGAALRCDRVVVAVPATVMRDGDISFEPPLPPAKADAVRRIRMLGACKLVLKFKRRFWPRTFQGAVCADCLAPEIWVNSTDEVGSEQVGAAQRMRASQPVDDAAALIGREHAAAAAVAAADATSSGRGAAASPVWHTITVFTTGPQADRLSAMPEARAVEGVLAQLDRMFSLPPADDSALGSRTPASDAFVAALRYSWADHPTIRGGYSFPSIHEKKDTRALAAAPLGGRVFFAGEATNVRSSLTIHGAMETGFRAACEAFASWGDMAAVDRICKRAWAANVPHVVEDSQRAAQAVAADPRPKL